MRLEQQMHLLIGDRTAIEPAPDDWKQTVGMFRGDEIVREMIEHARRVREEERTRLRDGPENRPE
jgi:hypothetical protein